MATRITPEQLADMVRKGARILSDSCPARLPGGRTTAKHARAPGEVPCATQVLTTPRPEPIRIDSRCMPAASAMKEAVGKWLWNDSPIVEYRSKLEARFSQRLIAEAPMVWAYELFTFRLAARTTYTPDFVQIHNGELIFYETKGYLWEKDSVKLKLFARLYPFPLVLVQREKGQWIEKVVPAE